MRPHLGAFWELSENRRFLLLRTFPKCVHIWTLFGSCPRIVDSSYLEPFQNASTSEPLQNASTSGRFLELSENRRFLLLKTSPKCVGSSCFNLDPGAPNSPYYGPGTRGSRICNERELRLLTITVFRSEFFKFRDSEFRQMSQAKFLRPILNDFTSV